MALKWDCFEHNRMQTTVDANINHIELSNKQLVLGHICLSFMLDCEIKEAKRVNWVTLVQSN